jgi:ComF family protein
VESLPEPVCRKCGYPLGKAKKCPDCAQEDFLFTRATALYIYDEPVKNALHRLKYNNDLGIAEIYAASLADYLKKLAWPIDLIVPVPLANRRKKERGYNQSGMLAYPLAMNLGLAYSSKALSRQRETESQVDLNGEERRRNVAGAFSASTEKVRGKVVLVVDDIITTGATMQECARALLTAGAREVYGLSVARTAKRLYDT